MPNSEKIPVGYVQSIKNDLSSKEAAAIEAVPEGMELVGWYLDGWVATYPLLDANARPVYAFSYNKEQ